MTRQILIHYKYYTYYYYSISLSILYIYICIHIHVYTVHCLNIIVGDGVEALLLRTRCADSFGAKQLESQQSSDSEFSVRCLTALVSSVCVSPVKETMNNKMYQKPARQPFIWRYFRNVSACVQDIKVHFRILMQMSN